MNYTIDINCDLGEGMDNDAQLMPYISSANIACGYHAGDDDTMLRTIELAQIHQVFIGAHPSYPDRENFGRKNMYFHQDEIYNFVKEQIEILLAHCVKSGAKLHHVKPHGALYNMAAKDERIAQAIAKAILTIDKHLILFGLSGSLMITIAQSMGLKTASEVFADRTYQTDGSLTPREQSNALLTNDDEVQEHVLRMIREQKVSTTENQLIDIQAETICIHGDGIHAAEFAKSIHKLLTSHQIIIQAPYENK